MLTVGSLFAGIGGLDLGLERAGMQVKWQVENDPYCIRVLEKHWPDVKRYGDVREVKWSEIEPVDLICGGFPCQSVSVAGRRKGDKDERWLWPEFLTAIREVRPRYALVENVPGLLSFDDGRLARRIKGDLAEQGYDSEGGCVSAYDVGAPHLRKRIFIVAYPIDMRRGKEPIIFTERFYSSLARDDGETRFMEDTNCERFSRSSISVFKRRPQQEDLNVSGAAPRDVSDTESAECERIRATWSRWPRPADNHWRDDPAETTLEPVVGGVADGLSLGMDGVAQDENGLYTPRATQKAVRCKSQRLECLGNAVVPQVAEIIGKAIAEAETQGR